MNTTMLNYWIARSRALPWFRGLRDIYAFDSDWDVEIHAANADEILFNKSPS
jgi:hypothetical protein